MIFYFFLIISFLLYTKQEEFDSDGSDIPTLFPDIKIELYKLKLNEEKLFYVNINDLKSIQIYKIMIHYLGPLGIDIKTKIICDDIHEIQKRKKNIKLNDYTEYDFWTNNNKIPKICGDNYNKKKFIISITPFSITYQFKEEDTIRFNAILELNTCPIKKDFKAFHIFAIRRLYRLVVFFIGGLPICLFLFRNKLRMFLLWVIGEKLDKEN